MIDNKQLKTAMGELDSDTVMDLLNTLMSQGGAGADQAMVACQEGMNIVGELFETQEYYVADLIYAGEIMTQAMDILKPAIARNSEGSGGKLILCTVKDDIHDIGKNIVKSFMEAGGIEVVDLGVDVSPEIIVKAAKDHNIAVIGLSGVLTLAIGSMKATVDEFIKSGMRDDVKIIIGGAPASSEYCEFVGADAWSRNAAEGVRICRDWLS
ncbi:MAG: cobalamin-dependent protein [Deferrisomatales bacterium]|nr:cobalamin-dependent protein [Deferrisomatales bacterium]